MSVFWLNVKLPCSCGAVKQREIGQQIQQIKHFLLLDQLRECEIHVFFIFEFCCVE